MRRIAVAVVVTGLVVGFTAGDGRTAPVDVLLADTDDGVVVVDAQAAGAPFVLAGALTGANRSTVVETTSDGDRTRVALLDARTGEERAASTVPDVLSARAVAGDGRTVALATPGGREPDGYPTGRRSTTLVVTAVGTGPTRSYDLDGVIEPEAFSTDRDSLFVLEFTPPEAPDRYRVRRLDLRTGRLHDLASEDGIDQVDMRGSAHAQALSPDGRRLYTLYTAVDPDGHHARAFVHVLALDEEWAHCIDLPEEFSWADVGAALAVSADGKDLYLTDPADGKVAAIDAEALRVTRTASLPSMLGAPTFAAVAGDRLFVAQETTVWALSTGDLGLAATVARPGAVVGLQAGAGGRRVYVAHPDRIVVVDAATGRLDGELLAGVGGIRGLRHVSPLVDAARGLSCAC